MSRDSFTECLFIGGPRDGKREMVADDMDIVNVYQISNADNMSGFIFADGLNMEPVQTFSANTVEYYRHPISAEGLRRSIDVFTNERDAKTGWLLQQLVAGYNPKKLDEDHS